MLPTKHTKEGVLNEKLALKKLLTYITSVVLNHKVIFDYLFKSSYMPV